MKRQVPGRLTMAVRKLCAGLILFFVFMVGTAGAATVTLTWNPNPETDIAGYIVVYGTAPGQYGTSVDVGNHTAFQFAEPDATVKYYFAVCAYNTAGLRSDFSPEVSTSDPPVTLALTSYNANVQPPQLVGQSIVFSAATSGGVAPPQYKWRVYDGAGWQVAQNWSTVSTFTWTPTAANPNYVVGVWARSSTSTADGPDNPASNGEIPFPITAPVVVVPPPLTVNSLSANVGSPQLLGASITFTAAATGGTSPYQFKWLVSNGGGWSVARDWSAGSTFTWTPAAASSNYSIGVWVRSAGNLVDGPENPSAGTTMPFAIVSGNVAITSLTANRQAPQPPGTKIVFTAVASGAVAYRYQWSVFNGVSWVVAQDWSSANKFFWTPIAPNRNYQVAVRAQNAANPADNAGASLLFPIANLGTNGNGHGRK
jgi:hypothetical protein